MYEYSPLIQAVAPVGYGLSPKYMFQEGWKMTIIVVVSMTLAAWVLLEYWPLFSE